MTDATARYRIEATNASGPGIQAALKDINSFGEKAKGLLEAAFAGISVGAITEALKKVVSTGIEVGDQLYKAAQKAGVSGEAISQLAYAAKLADVGLDDLSKSLGTMQRNLSLASTGGKEQNTALKALGLTFQDLKGLAPDKQFELLGNQISKLKDPTDRARASQEIFGKAWQTLIPLFADGAKGIEAARQEAVKFGESFSDEQLKQLSDADETIKKMNSSFEALAATLASKVAPSLNSGFKTLTGLLGNDGLAKIQSQIDILKKADSVYGSLPGPISSLSGLSSGEAPTFDPRTWLRGMTTHSGRLAQIASMQGGLDSIAEAMRTSTSFAGTDQFPPAPGYNPPDPGYEAWKAAMLYDARHRGAPDETTLGVINPQTLEDTRSQTDQFFKDITTDSDESLKKIGKMLEDAVRQWSLPAEAFDVSMKGAFDNMIETGEFSFRELVDDFVKELSRREIFTSIDKITDALNNAWSGGSNDIWRTLLGLGSSAFASVGSGAYANSVLSDEGFGNNFHVQDIPIPHAAGGSVTPGLTYLVGEKGPELFTSRTSGQVISHSDLASMVGSGRGGDAGSSPIIYSPVINITGKNTVTSEDVTAALARSQRDMVRYVQEQSRRGGLRSN